MKNKLFIFLITLFLSPVLFISCSNGPSSTTLLSDDVAQVASVAVKQYGNNVVVRWDASTYAVAYNIFVQQKNTTTVRVFYVKNNYKKYNDSTGAEEDNDNINKWSYLLELKDFTLANFSSGDFDFGVQSIDYRGNFSLITWAAKVSITKP